MAVFVDDSGLKVLVEQVGADLLGGEAPCYPQHDLGIGPHAASAAATQPLSASSKTYLLQTFPLKIHLFSQDRFGGPVGLPDVSRVFI